MRLIKLLVFFGFVLLSPLSNGRDLSKTPFSIAISEGDAQKVLSVFASKSGLKLRTRGIGGKLSYRAEKVSLDEALTDLCRKQGWVYAVTNDELIISNAPKMLGERRLPASELPKPPPLPPGVRVIMLKHMTAAEMVSRIKDLFGKADGVIAVEGNNSIILSRKANYANVQEAVDKLDILPKQILIEAQVVETSSNFSQSLGIDYTSLNKDNGGVDLVLKGGSIASPNLRIGSKIGRFTQAGLDITLKAAEARGDAKVISRPKIVTPDRMPATINSGITYSIKTVGANSPSTGSGGSSGSGGGSGAGGALVPTGITSVNAGLTLNVTPTIVEDGLIKMYVSITNSEADLGLMVDGIPGIVNNTATTTLMVAEGETATIGGLIKHSTSQSMSGPPLLSRIPLLGWLFKSVGNNEINKELVLFITPRILADYVQQRHPAATTSEVEDALAAAAPARKTELDAQADAVAGAVSGAWEKVTTGSKGAKETED